MRYTKLILTNSAAHSLITSMSTLDRLLPGSTILRFPHFWHWLYHAALCQAYISIKNARHSWSLELVQDIDTALTLFSKAKEADLPLSADYYGSLKHVEELVRYVLDRLPCVVGQPLIAMHRHVMNENMMSASGSNHSFPLSRPSTYSEPLEPPPPRLLRPLTGLAPQTNIFPTAVVHERNTVHLAPTVRNSFSPLLQQTQTSPMDLSFFQ